MATKYTKSNPTEDAARVTGNEVRFRRFSTAPPSRKALSWVIIGIALIVVLLMIVPEFPVLDLKSTTDDYVWRYGTVVSNELSEGQRVLRVELHSEGDAPPHVYDISLDNHGDWTRLAAEDAVRIQAELDAEGDIKRIIGIEPVEGTATSEGDPANQRTIE